MRAPAGAHGQQAPQGAPQRTARRDRAVTAPCPRHARRVRARPRGSGATSCCARALRPARGGGGPIPWETRSSRASNPL